MKIKYNRFIRIFILFINFTLQFTPKLFSQNTLGVTIFEFQKTWNHKTNQLDVDGKEFLYITKFDMSYNSSNSLYAATAPISNGADLNAVIAISLDQNNIIKELHVSAVAPSSQMGWMWLLACWSNLVSSINTSMSREKVYQSIIKKLVKEFESGRSKSNTLISGNLKYYVTVQNNAIVFSITHKNYNFSE